VCIFLYLHTCNMFYSSHPTWGVQIIQLVSMNFLQHPVISSLIGLDISYIYLLFKNSSVCFFIYLSIYCVLCPVEYTSAPFSCLKLETEPP
jgi:hypothetical protein